MKKVILFLLTLICLFSIGCTKDSKISNSSDNSPQTKPTVDETIIDHILPASAKETSTKGLYTFENGIDHSSISYEASINGDVLRVEFITPGLDTVTIKVVTYSLSKDKVLGEVTLPEGNFATGNLDNGGFYSISLTSTEVSFYNKNCKETYNDQLYSSDFMWNNAVISSDGTHLIYNRALDGSLVLYSFTTGTDEEIGDEKGIFVPIRYKDGYFYIRSYESGIYKVSPKENKLEPVLKHNIGNFVTTEYSINEMNSYFVITPIDDAENRQMTPMKNKNEIPMATKDGYFATVANDQDSSLRLYNIKDSTVSPEISIQGFIQCVLFSSQDMVLVISHDTNTEQTLYYLYDFTSSDDFESIDIAEYDESKLSEIQIPEWTGDAETISLAQNILDKYNVRIIYGDLDIDSKTIGYTIKPVDDKTALTTMEWIEDCLNYFPEGMTQEIGRGSEVWIYLCTEITNTETGGTVNGFAFTLENHSTIFIDVKVSEDFFKESFMHECSHIIEYCIDFDLLNGWLNLMPESIASTAYANSYNANVDLTYTPYSQVNTEVWFYDSYSKTYPTEDRAVIFQKMYLSSVNGKKTDEFEAYENLEKKAIYYCHMLSQTFDSCKNADTLPWEEPFNYNP